MAVTTGPAVYPGAGTFPGSSQYPGQGDEPILWAMVSFSSFDNPTPVWTDMSNNVRSFSISRGRDSEQSEMGAGTATVTLDNRGLSYDPVTKPSVRPMNRIWLRRQFNGRTDDMFYGYVESWDQQWPGTGYSDQIAVANAVDELKVLGLTAVPNMNPPRDTYADLVSYDNPTNYWRWSDNNLNSTTTIETVEFPTYHWTYNGFEWDTVDVPHTVQGFQDWVIGNGVGFVSSFDSGPIVGDLQDIISGLGGYPNMQSAGPYSIIANSTAIGDPMAGTAYTVETWFQKSGNPLGTTGFMQGPESNQAGVRTWSLNLTSTGTIQFTYRDSGGTDRTVTTTTALSNDTWYHLVAELDGANLRIFINGVQDATASSGTGSFRPTNTASGAPAQILGIGTVSNLYFDETAFYLKTALPVARALAHYQAGALRGFRGGNTLGTGDLRFGQVLDSVGSEAERSVIGVNATGLQPTFQHGQDPLQELRKCALSQLPNGMLFAAKDGTVTLLGTLARLVSPYDTAQMTFNDKPSAGQRQYADLDVDYSDSYITNEWSGNKTGGTLVTQSDATSISTYGKRSQTLSDLPITDDPTTILSGMLAKYKDPVLRILRIDLDCSDLDVLNEVFQRDLGHCIRILKDIPHAAIATSLDQTSYIQKIEIDGSNDGTPWKVRLGVSPL